MNIKLIGGIADGRIVNAEDIPIDSKIAVPFPTKTGFGREVYHCAKLQSKYLNSPIVFVFAKTIADSDGNFQ